MANPIRRSGGKTRLVGFGFGKIDFSKSSLSPGGPSNMKGQGGMVTVHAYLRKGKPVRSYQRKEELAGGLAKLTFTDAEYQFSHGRKPRGVGGWAFQRATGPYIRHKTFGPIYWKRGTLSQAKNAMRISKGKRYKGYMAVLS
jgi:hypothetical protein